MSLAPTPSAALSRVEAARYVGVSPSSFDKLVTAGTMPQPRRAVPTCRLVWLRSALDAALAALPPADGSPVPVPALADASADTWSDFT